MYRRKILYLAALVVSLILAVTGCSPKKTENMPGSEGAAHCEIYYIDNINQTLKFEMMAVDGKSQEEQVFDAYKKMRDVQKTEERKSAVPDGLDINSVYIDSGILGIDFNAIYNTMELGDELIFKTAVVYTFTSFQFIDYVYITVDGQPLEMTSGQTVGKLGRKDIVIDGNISAEPTNYEILTLYFKSADGTKLGTEIREVEVNPNQPIERYIIEQLIEGPGNSGLKSVIPSDTKIRDISSADGVCYVDLSSEFVTRQSGSEKDALAAVYSIVNSLAEMETINKVQFLIEGEKYDKYGHIVDLTKPVEPNYDITFE